MRDRELVAGRPGRPGWVARGSGIAALAACAALISACGGSSSDSSTTSGTEAAATGTTTSQQAGGGDLIPVKGPIDSVTWNLTTGEPTSLYPGKGFDNSSLTTLGQLCNTLMTRTPDGKLEPSLATSVTEPDPKTIVYKIRQGVKFFDGTTMTPDDVVYTLSQHLKPTDPLVAFSKNVVSIKATGPDEVTVKLKKPDVVWRAITETGSPNAIVEKSYYTGPEGKKAGTPSGGVACTGPFTLKKWTPSSDIVLEANPNYWDTANAPKASQIVFKFATDSSAVTAGLLSGELDGASDLASSSLEALKNSDVGQVYAAPTGTFTQLTVAGGLLKDADVRRALSLVIDRAGIAKAAFGGAAQPISGFYSPWTWTYEADAFKAAEEALPGHTPDLEAAKAAFEKAGSPSTPITLAVLGGDSSMEKMAALIQASAQQIGMNIKVKSMAPSSFGNLLLSPDARKGVDAFFFLNGNLSPEPAEEPYQWLAKDSYLNMIGYDNPQVVEMVHEAQSTPDEAKRAQLLIDAQKQFIGEDWAQIPVAVLDAVSFVNNKIGGYVPTAYNQSVIPWAADLGSSK